MEKCPCETDVQSCCACVSMHCDECHKPNRTKFVQGRFCSNCGRPLKNELVRAYVPKSEVEILQGALKAEERHNELTMEMAQKAIQNAKIEVMMEIELECVVKWGNSLIFNQDNFVELKKKYTGEKK